jgi:hypothetical protein
MQRSRKSPAVPDGAPALYSAHEVAAFARGVELFNARRFFDAHEVWEEIWLPSTGHEKRFLQGLIQIAAAFHHHSRENLLGTESLLRAGVTKLVSAPQSYRGIHAARICVHARRWIAALEKGNDVSARVPPQLEPAGATAPSRQQKSRQKKAARK